MQSRLALNIMFLAIIVTFASHVSLPQKNLNPVNPIQTQTIAVPLRFGRFKQDELSDRDDIFAGEIWDSVYSQVLFKVEEASIVPIQTHNEIQKA